MLDNYPLTLKEFKERVEKLPNDKTLSELYDELQKLFDGSEFQLKAWWDYDD